MYTRRPGGVVPKAPFEDPDAKNPYHEMMNAYQQLEEKGIPLPLKYNLDFQRAVRDVQAAENKENIDRIVIEARKRFEGRVAPPPRPIFTEMRVPNYAPRRKHAEVL